MKQNVPVPEAQSRIDALTEEIGHRMKRRATRLQTIFELQAEADALLAEIHALKQERHEILRTCERVEVDR